MSAFQAEEQSSILCYGTNKIRMAYKDAEQSKAKIREHYRANKSYYAEKKDRRRQLFKDILKDLKNSPCVDCGNSYPSCAMDFDHLHGKEENVSRLINCGNLTKLLKEIAKCELVCANCHRIRTSQRLSQPMPL